MLTCLFSVHTSYRSNAIGRAVAGRWIFQPAGHLTWRALVYRRHWLKCVFKCIFHRRDMGTVTLPVYYIIQQNGHSEGNTVADRQ